MPFVQYQAVSLEETVRYREMKRFIDRRVSIPQPPKSKRGNQYPLPP